MYELDTRAVFVGGPIDGRMEMLPGKPYAWQVDEFSGDLWSDSKTIRHTYYRKESMFMEGDMIAYVHGGEEVMPYV